MSLIKFLAAGSSVSNSGVSLPYREKKGVFLPKFGSDKNPFAKTPPTETPTELPLNPVPPKSAKITAPVTPPAPTPARPVEPKRSIQSAPSNWVASLNPLAIFRNTSVRPARPARAEQTELSLDTVKVVGNDLSDTNVDVVPLKSRPAPRKRSPAQAEQWGEVGTGAFEVNLV